MAQCCLVTSISIGVLLIVGGAILAGIDVGSKIVDEELQKVSCLNQLSATYRSPPHSAPLFCFYSGL